MGSKIILNLILCLIAINCIGCSDNSRNSSDIIVKIEFNKDDKTVRNDEAWLYDMKESDASSDYEVNEPQVNLGEIKLENSDDSVYYEVSGNDIVYNGVVYKDLYYNVQHLQLPCDINTFINFIIKTYDTNSNEVDTLYVNDTEASSTESDDVGASISVDESLRDSDYYLQLVEKYNNVAKWRLMLIDENDMGILYGCESFILYNGGNGVTEIDMNKYNFGG